MKLITISRLIETNLFETRAILPETNGITLFYEKDDVGCGAMDWVCKGDIEQSRPDYRELVDGWLNGDILS